MRWLLSLLGLCSLVAGALWFARTPDLGRLGPEAESAEARGRANRVGHATPTAAPPERSRGATPPTVGSRIIIGGGSFPESTEVSLEQDVLLARRVMGPDLRVLFAGGEAASSVRELTAATQVAGELPLLTHLGDVFAPRPGRQSRYRRPSLPAAGRATETDVRALLLAAMALRGEPLWLHVAAHGEQGETPRDNRVGLWAGGVLHVDELAKLHDDSPRPLRLVIASCYSGGFAELAFEGADEQRGPSSAPRCGLFAGTWDRQTSGCDPDPDRRAQEGYSLHFLHALRGEDREGRPLPPGEVDLDGDGERSLLEAHTRARVASVSIDVPTTTSERLLRSLQTERGAADSKLLPEEWAVVTALAGRLGIGGLPAAQARFEDFERRLAQLDDSVVGAEDAVQAAYLRLAAVLLERWPVLDDPYHPEFASTLERDHDAIAEVLARSMEARDYGGAQRALDAADATYWDLRVQEAMLSRYLRAHETLELASALRSRGGADWDAYVRLLACERWVPPSRGAQGAAHGLE